MKFEGNEFLGPDDVLGLLRERRATNPRDFHPWQWAQRLVDAHPEARPWVDQALTTLLEGGLAGGPDLELLHDVVATARLCGVRGIAPRLVELLDDEEAISGPEESRWLLNALLDLPPERPDRGVLDAMARHGRREGCFNAAAQLLWELDRQAGARFVLENLPGVLEASDEAGWILDVVALMFVDQAFEPFRAELLRVVVSSDQELRDAFVGSVEENLDEDFEEDRRILTTLRRALPSG